MSWEKTGGPAFPGPSLSDNLGMTLRDYFAAKVVSSYLDEIHFNDKPVPGNFEIEDYAATQAYMLADAMLKARAE